MNKEQENRFKENIKKIARQELKNSFTDNLMETLNSAFIFKYVQTLEEQSKKYKEVIDKVKTNIENDIDGFRTINEFGESQAILELLDTYLDILKEVE